MASILQFAGNTMQPFVQEETHASETEACQLEAGSAACVWGFACVRLMHARVSGGLAKSVRSYTRVPVGSKKEWGKKGGRAVQLFRYQFRQF